MKKIILSLMVFSFLGLKAQVMITPFNNTSIAINDSTIEIIGNQTDNDITYYAKVINTSNFAQSVKVVRTELDVLSGTENTTCWMLCPPFIMAGTQPIYLSGHTAIIGILDTNDTFVAHYKPSNLDGCSMFRYDFVNSADTSEIYGTFYIRFAHSTTQCLAYTNDLESNIELYPNPSADHIFFSETYKEISIYNMVGKQVFASGTNTNTNYLDLSFLQNGVYIVNIKDLQNREKTIKLILEK